MPRLRRVDLVEPAELVAPRLLGATLVVTGADGRRRLRLVEVEAYGGDEDPASHAYRGPTPRCAVMFGPPGHLYVYRSYGVHWCANVVTGPEGRASAVLLRAGELLDERGRVTGLVRGPGLLTRALGLSGTDSGLDVVGPGARRAWLLAAREPVLATRTGRVGLTRERERPWRFLIEGHRAAGRGPRPST